MERAPVVFEGNMSFVFGSNKLHQTIRPVPAYLERSTVSHRLSSQIENFLNKTDHVKQEWSALHKRKDDTLDAKHLGRSKSVSNIMIKGFQLMKHQPSMSRSNSAYRQISEDDDDRTICEEVYENQIICVETHILQKKKNCGNQVLKPIVVKIQQFIRPNRLPINFIHVVL
jgi:hypothetical protein